MQRKFYKKSNISGLGKLFIGAGIAVASLLLFTVLFGGIALLFEDVSAMIPVFAIATILVSSIVSGGIVARKVNEGNIPLSLLSALMASLAFMLVGAIVSGGALPFSVFLNFLIFVGAFTLSAYLLRKRDKFDRRFMR